MLSAAVAENKIFQALADPSRRAIFESLTRGETAVKDLTARFDISQPAVSQHLAALKDAGLVNGRREGRCIYYRVEPRGMKPLIDWIAHYRAFWTDRIDRLDKLLKELRQSPNDRVDARAYLAARLQDIYLGDWDRHPDQWEWVRHGDTPRWEAYPKDRDMAFINFDGLAFGFLRGAHPMLVRFGPLYPKEIGRAHV